MSYVILYNIYYKNYADRSKNFIIKKKNIFRSAWKFENYHEKKTVVIYL